MALLGVLSANTGSRVQDLHVQLSGTLDDLKALLGGNARGNLGGVLVVVHQQELQILSVVDDELVEVVGEHVTSGLS